MTVRMWTTCISYVVVLLAMQVVLTRGKKKDDGDEVYNLNDKCNAVIDVPGNKDVQLLAKGGTTLTSEENCTVNFKARPGRKNVLTFTTFDLPKKNDGSCEEALTLYDGEDDSAPALTEANGLCGALTEIKDFHESTTENITVKFTTGESGLDNGFTLVVTSASEGNCTDSEFKCDNGNCIDANLVDNFRDNCGDKSDEGFWRKTALTVWEKLMEFGLAAAIGIIVAGVVVFIIITVCLVCCICKCCCSKVTPI
ncbi:uncharacterized protein LOC144437719 [Glandiceps talaboti]